jgi:D-amino peptidase
MRFISIQLGLALVILAGHVSASNPPKILIIYDMEGISGVVSPSYERYQSSEYPQGRESLTADVNAAIRGLKAGGAGAIWVEDGHGSGNGEEPDLLVDKLNADASFDFRDRPYDPYSTGIDASVDAIVCIGMHARARTRGFMAHTYTFDVAWQVNGLDLTETHIVALSASRWGIPVIMVSGDNILAEQLPPDFPELEFAVVKTARSLSSAEAVPRAEADHRIEATASLAMQKFLAGKFRAYYLPPPYDFRLSFRTAEQGQMAASTPGVSVDGDLGVRYGTKTFIEGYNLATDVIQHAMNPLPLLIRILRHEPNGEKILKQWEDLIWLQIDPDQLPKWSLPPASSQEKKKYYGDR